MVLGGVKVLFFVCLLMFTSWASGALDPESSSSGDHVTSVKRCGLVCLCDATSCWRTFSIDAHYKILISHVYCF